MSIAIVTGSSGLIGSETARFLHEQGMHVVGIDNNMREYFFGKDASTVWNTGICRNDLSGTFPILRPTYEIAIASKRSLRNRGNAISLIVHTAAQPSHDWAAREPLRISPLTLMARLCCWKRRDNFPRRGIYFHLHQ